MRLFWKLFLLQAVAAIAVIAGALLVTRLYSMRGFGEYLEARERARVQEIAGELAEHVRDTGDLRAAAERLPALRLRRVHGERHGEPPAGEPRPREADAPRDERPRRHVMIRRVEGGVPPLQVQDPDGGYVFGDRRPFPGERLREPVTLDGRVIGYLAWPRLPRQLHAEHDEFARKQARHFAFITPVALAIALVFAGLITALIVRPIRRLSEGATALAARRFELRLPDGGRDELGQLARDFNRLAEALQGYDTRQRQWLADIAHELRTPVAVLRGELEAVLEGVRPAGPEALRSLRQEVARIEALIHDLHLVSLAESGGLVLHRAPTDVGALVRAAVARFRTRLATHGFDVREAIADGLVASVDAQRLEQVVANLLENVVRHASPPGPVTIAAGADAGRVVVSVADAGPGVPAEALPRLFDRLYRVETARTRATGGAGLGLAICRSVVAAHGGTIVAQRSAQGGLEIVLTL